MHYGFMRLSEVQRTEIIRTAREEFGPNVAVTLFGSRVDDAAKGGDIDLMITTTLDEATARSAKIRFLVRLKQRIGDQRIDVVLRPSGSEERPIHRVAATQGVAVE